MGCSFLHPDPTLKKTDPALTGTSFQDYTVKHVFHASLAAHTKIYIPYLMKTAQIKLLKGSTELYRGHDPAEWDSFGGQNRLLKESTELC